MTEGWGNDMRRIVGKSLSNHYQAFGTGLGVTMLLQSSSATALLTSSFSGQGLLTAGSALAVILGADVGTALVAQILTLGKYLCPKGLSLIHISEPTRLV